MARRVRFRTRIKRILTNLRKYTSLGVSLVMVIVFEWQGINNQILKFLGWSSNDLLMLWIIEFCAIASLEWIYRLLMWCLGRGSRKPVIRCEVEPEFYERVLDRIDSGGFGTKSDYYRWVLRTDIERAERVKSPSD